MKILVFLLAFALPIACLSQSVGYLRYDTVKIMKQGGSAELVLLNKTRDSVGLLTNVGGGRTEFRRSHMLNDSTIIVGVDTLRIRAGGASYTKAQVDSITAVLRSQGYTRTQIDSIVTTLAFNIGNSGTGINVLFPSATGDTTLARTFESSRTILSDTLPTGEIIHNLNTDTVYKDIGGIIADSGFISSKKTNNLAGNSVYLKDSTAAGTPLLIVENKYPGAYEGIHIKAALASLRMYATDTSGYAGISCFANGSHKLSIGYDGPANHVYMADVRNTPLSTWEVDGHYIGGFFTGTENFWFGSPSPSPIDNDARVHIYGNQTSGALKVSSNVADDFEQIQVTTRYGGIKIKTKHPSGFASTNLYNSLDERIGTYGSDAANNEVFMSSDHEGGKLGFRTKVSGSNPTRMIIRNNGIVNIAVTPEYADNAAAVTAGLVAGDIYRTGDELKIVH